MIYIPNVWLKPYLKRKFYRHRGSTLAKMITRNRLLQSYEIQGGRARARRTASRQGRPTAGAAACRWARRAINARHRSFLPNAKMAIFSCLVPSAKIVCWTVFSYSKFSVTSKSRWNIKYNKWRIHGTLNVGKQNILLHSLNVRCEMNLLSLVSLR